MSGSTIKSCKSRNCDALFDSSLNYSGEPRSGGPPRSYCTLGCKSVNGNTPERQRAYSLRRKYGVSVQQFEEMLEQQGGGCAICGGGQDDKRQMHVDHDHVTGAVRGILCTYCNPGLGYFRDSPELLLRAIYYLAETRD